MNENARVKLIQKFLAEVGIEWDGKCRKPLNAKVVRDAVDKDMTDIIDLKVQIAGKDVSKRFFIKDDFFLMYSYETNELEETFIPEWKAFKARFIEDDRKEVARLKSQQKFHSQSEAMMEERLDEILGPKINTRYEDEYEDE